MEKFIFLGEIDQKSRHGCVKSEHVLCLKVAWVEKRQKYVLDFNVVNQN